MTSDDRIDWSQLWYPGPRRVFSAAEMARAGGDKPSRTFTVVLAVNLAVFAQALLFNAPEGQGARLLGILVAIFVAAYQGGMLLWRRPWVPRLLQLGLVLGTAEWLWTTFLLAQQRLALGQPWQRMVLILLAVALFTAASAAVLGQRRVRERYC